MENHKKETLSWQGPEYFYREKKGDWYWAVGIISAALTVAAVMLKNYVFAVFIVLAVFSLTLFAAKKPKIVEIKIDDKGILFDRYFYPYHSLESFWVNDTSERILLKSKKLLMPLIVLPLEYNNPTRIREFLGEHLPEEELYESPFQKLLEIIGF